MLYRTDGRFEPANPGEAAEQGDGRCFVGLFAPGGLRENAARFGLEIEEEFLEFVKEPPEDGRMRICSGRTQYFGILRLINADSIFCKPDLLAFFIFPNCFLAVPLDDADAHVEALFSLRGEALFAGETSAARVACLFLNELLFENGRYMERLQEEIDEMERHDTQKEALLFTKRHRKLAKELLLVQNYFDGLTFVGEELQMNDYDIFPEKELRLFDILTGRMKRWAGQAQMLREILKQAGDAHRAKLDLGMNRTMQFFTMVTTLVLPLTLVTGWYGMNFSHMPELESRYGYPAVAALCAALVAGLVFYFKKKHYL